MYFHVNSVDGAGLVVREGSFNFADLVSYEDDHNNYDYRVYSDAEKEGIRSVFIELKNNAFDNIFVDGATNLMIQPPDIVEIESGHWSMDTSIIDETYPAGTPAPDDFSLGAYTWYYTKNTLTSSDGTSQKFDQYNLIGWNTSIPPTWDNAVEHYKITGLTRVLYLPNNNCFGVGTKWMRYSTQSTTITLENRNTIFSQFLGSDSGQWAQNNNPWALKKGGVLSGKTIMNDIPWNAPAAVSVKAPFNSSKHGSPLPSVPEFTNSGFYIVGTNYDDTQFIGVLGVVRNAEGIITSASLQLADLTFWNPKQSNTNYVVNPDGTVSKAQNPNYVKSNDRWKQSSLPDDGANRLVTGANFIHKLESNNRPYGFATYALSRSDYMHCIADWTNTLTMSAGQYAASWLSGDALLHPIDTASNIINGITADPIASILKAHTIPVPSGYIRTTGTPALTYVRSGGIDSTVLAANNMLHNDGRIISVNCTSNQPVGRCTGWFDDYTNTNISVFVPFVGEIPLSTEEVLDESIYVRYRIDVMSGDFIVTVDNGYSQIKTLSGNCSIPIICSSSATLTERVLGNISGAIASGVQIATSISTNNIPGIVSGAVNMAGNISQNMNQNVCYAQIGGDGGLFSGLYKPVLIIRRPIQASGDFGGVQGFMSGSVVTLSRAQAESGLAYVSVVSVDTKGIEGATAAEKEEIEALLKEGVYI